MVRHHSSRSDNSSAGSGGRAERKERKKNSSKSRHSSSSRRHHRRHTRSRSRSEEDDYRRDDDKRKRRKKSSDSRKESRSHSDENARDGESKEDRLLRKAKEYVAKQEGNRNQKDIYDDDGSGGDDDSHHNKHRKKKKSHGGSRKEELSSSHRRKRDKHHDDYDDGDYRKEHRDRKKHKSSSRNRSHHKTKDHRHHDDSEKTKKTKSAFKGHRTLKIDRAALIPLGNVVGKPPSTLLDVDKDYFTFHHHLWVYLYREEGVAFGDLSSEEAREAFQRFTTQYNKGSLEAAYYNPKGLPSNVIDQCQTTRHTWSFNTSTTEQQSLQLLQQGVRRQTEYHDTTTTTKNMNKNDPASKSTPTAAATTPAPQPNPNYEEYRKKTPAEIAAERAANKRLQKHIQTAEEEFSGGRKDGRDRQLEKRKERAAVLHGSAKDREELMMGGIEMSDQDIYGSGRNSNPDDNFELALAREKRNKARREEKRSSRINQLQDKEQERQEAMLKSLGLTGIKPGQKIKIQPRRDT